METSRLLWRTSRTGSIMKTESKRVPALDKCFAILGLLADSSEPLGISSIARETRAE